MNYRGFDVIVGNIYDSNDNPYEGLIAYRNGIKIESPHSDPLNLTGLERAIDEFVNNEIQF